MKCRNEKHNTVGHPNGAHYCHICGASLVPSSSFPPPASFGIGTASCVGHVGHKIAGLINTKRNIIAFFAVAVWAVGTVIWYYSRQEPDYILEQSKVAYKNGLQLMGDKHYEQAINEFGRVVVRDRRYNDAQINLVQTIKLYREDLFKSVSALESRGEYQECINRLNAARSVIHDDNKVSSELARFALIILENEKKIVIGRIKEIDAAVLSSQNYDKGVADLEALRSRHPKFKAEITTEISKFTSLISERDRKIVREHIREITNNAVTSKSYDEDIAALEKLRKSYPKFNEEINRSISGFKEMRSREEAIVRGAIQNVNNTASSDKTYNKCIDSLKELLNEHPKFKRDIDAAISSLVSARNRDEYFVNNRIREINESAKSRKNYDDGIAELNKLRNYYPEFNTQINTEINNLISMREKEKTAAPPIKPTPIKPLICLPCHGRGYFGCPQCNGKRYTTQKMDCLQCGGTGIIVGIDAGIRRRIETKCKNCSSGKIFITNTKPCSTCRGEGKITCKDCNGKGKYE